MDIKEFLKDQEIQALLEDGRLEEIYSKLPLSNRPQLTKFLMDIGIEPIDYLHKIITAMYYQLPITNIEIPDSVASIGTNAFERCTSLETIKLPKNLYTIQSCAFYGCDSLKEVIIPEGTNTISKYAFAMCRNLKRVIMPDSIKTISSDAFDGCINLTITCSKDNHIVKEYCFFENINCEEIL